MDWNVSLDYKILLKWQDESKTKARRKKIRKDTASESQDLEKAHLSDYLE